MNEDCSVSVLDSKGRSLHEIPALALTGGGIGYLYERVVGLKYEELGYAVEYRSCLGYADRGVDLVARLDGECRFIQCKYRLTPIGPAAIERLLHAASSFVHQNLAVCSNYFDLVVPSEMLVFPRRKGGERARSAYFKYNSTQNRIRLCVKEIGLPLPENIRVGATTPDLDTQAAP